MSHLTQQPTAMNSANIIHPGFYSSIQDLGRKAYRDLGVPHSGAMDQEAMRLANSALGNTADAAVLEMIMQGVTLVFSQLTFVMVIGVVDEVKVNDEVQDFSKPIKIKSGDRLKIGRMVKGHFAYLAITSGWQSEKVMGSRSMFHGITPLARLSKGDVLKYQKEGLNIPKGHSVALNYYNKLNVHKGPEFHALPEDYKIYLANTEFKVSASWNRMAYVLKTDKAVDVEQIATAPVLPGTIQLTPAGDLNLLMRDAQTTGGYPRILQLSDQAINQLTRKQVGETILFTMVDV
ncbi:MAG: biotin-dependent carboxyltransferase family protein [Nonlabens sp.]